jgi:nicotinamidase-related amidase
MDPSTAALVIIDMQEHFRPCAAPLIPRLASLAAAARSAGVPVVWTQHGHPDPAADAAHSNLVRWWGPDNSIELGSPAWQVLPGLGVDRQLDTVIDEKRTYNAFHKTRLKALLKDNHRTAVVIGGVMTELCCETTARSAFVKGFDVVFLSDGTGTEAASHHKATLAALKFGFATIATCAEVEAAWSRKRV